METKTKNLIKLSSNDIDSSMRKKSLIEEYNKKLQLLRTNQLYKSIKEAGEVRSELFQKLRKWITLLEDRIFDPQTIQDLDIARVIGLFEHLGAFSLSMLKQSGDMDTLMKSYIDTQASKEILTTQPQQPELSKDQEALKATLMKSFLDSLCTKSEDAQVIDVKKEPENFSNSVPGKLTEKNPKPEDLGFIEDLTLDEQHDDDKDAPSCHDNGKELDKHDKTDTGKIELDTDEE